MKKTKLWLLLFSLFLISAFMFSGCLNDGESGDKFLVGVSIDDDFLEKIAYYIYDEKGALLVKNDEGGEKDFVDEVFIELSVDGSFDFNYIINEDALNEYVVANSKYLYNLSETEQDEVIESLNEKYTDLMESGLSEQETLNEIKKDADYIKYSPLDIEWTKVNSQKWLGKVALTKDIIFSVNGDIVEKESFDIYTISNNTSHYRYQLKDSVKSTNLGIMLEEYNVGTVALNFEKDVSSFQVILEETSIADPPELLKIYYVYLDEAPSSITKDDILNAEKVFEADLTYYAGKEGGNNFYASSGGIIVPEQMQDEELTREYRYIAIYVEADE